MSKKFDPKRIPAVLNSIEFEVVGDSDWTPYQHKITQEVEDALKAAAQVARNGPNSDRSVAQIRKYIERYPTFPMFKNYLITFYSKHNRLNEAQQVIDECRAAHPEYFYNEVMQAGQWITEKKNLDKIPALLAHWDITAYAGRAKFAEHELRVFYLTVANYCLETFDMKNADGFVYFLEYLTHEKDHPNLLHLRKKIELLRGLNLFRKKR